MKDKAQHQIKKIILKMKWKNRLNILLDLLINKKISISLR